VPGDLHDAVAPLEQVVRRAADQVERCPGMVGGYRFQHLSPAHPVGMAFE
jgi:hypothetical protein